MSEYGFYVLDDGTVVVNKALFGGKVSIKSTQRNNDERFLSNCLDQLLKGEQDYADATIKRQKVQQSKPYIKPEIIRQNTSVKGSSYMANPVIPSYTITKKFDKSKEYFCPQNESTRVDSVFISANTYTDYLDFRHPSSQWIESRESSLEESIDSGFGDFTNTQFESFAFQLEGDNNNNDNVIDEDKFYGSIQKCYELHPVNEEGKKIYYNLILCSPFYFNTQNDYNRTFDVLEPLNATVTIVIASKQKMLFRLLPVNFVDKETVYYEEQTGSVEHSYSEREEGYYYRIEITPAWRRTVYLSNKYCAHGLCGDMNLQFKFEDGLEHPFSMGIERGEPSWGYPVKSTSYNLQSTYGGKLNGYIYFRISDDAASVKSYKGPAKVVYGEDGDDSTIFQSVEITFSGTLPIVVTPATSWNITTLKRIEIYEMPVQTFTAPEPQ